MPSRRRTAARRSRSEFGEGAGRRGSNGRGRISQPIRQARDRGRRFGGEGGQEMRRRGPDVRARIVQRRHQDAARGRMMSQRRTRADDGGDRPSLIIRPAKGEPRPGELRGHRGPDAGIGVPERGQEPIDDHRGREVLPRDGTGRRQPYIQVAALHQFQERGAQPGREAGILAEPIPRGPAGRRNPGRGATAQERRARAVSRSAWRSACWPGRSALRGQDPWPGSDSGAQGRERPHCPDANAPIGRHPRCPESRLERSAGSSALRRSIRAGKAASPIVARAKAAPRQRRSAGACRLSTIASMEPSPRRPKHAMAFAAASRTAASGSFKSAVKAGTPCFAVVPTCPMNPATLPRIRGFGSRSAPISWGMAAAGVAAERAQPLESLLPRSGRPLVPFVDGLAHDAVHILLRRTPGGTLPSRPPAG